MLQLGLIVTVMLEANLPLHFRNDTIIYILGSGTRHTPN